MSKSYSAESILKAVNLWNAADIDRHADLLDEDCVIEIYSSPDIIRGRGAARKLLRRYLDAMPDVSLEVTDIVSSGNLMVARWVARPSRRSQSKAGWRAVGGCTVATTDHGKYVHLWHYWDTDPMSRP